MWRFIVVSFLLLGWGFYELSGGSDFVLETRGTAEASVSEPSDGGLDDSSNATNGSPSIVAAALLPSAGTSEPAASATVIVTETDAGQSQEALTTNRIEVTALSPSQAPRIEPAVIEAALEAVEAEVSAAPAANANTTENGTPSATPQLLIVEDLPTVRETEGTPDEPVVIAALSPSNDVRFVTADRMNFRSGPGTNFEIIGKVVNGDLTYVLESDGTGWVRVQLENGTVGWLAERFLSAS